ncbi:putative bifunctional diguanylate cyclase/phosphodiesterase [Novilysobacter antarcticus]|uniref:putative bifunctional diguanylate cyclase/phosphodiesterase n=1 Tax=Novilysobacter antarcticus TaxID=2862543 RepID=UPI0031BAAA96
MRHHTTSIAHAPADPAALHREGGGELLPMIDATLPPGSRLHLRARGDSIRGGSLRSSASEWEEDAGGAHRIELDWDGEQGESVLVVELPQAMTAAQRTAWMVLATRTIELHLTAVRARARVKELEKSEQLQQALYEIADLAGSTLELADMLQRIHGVVARLMYAENFYIVLYDEAAQTYRFLYFADQMDTFRPDPAVEIPVDSAPNSLTMALIRHGDAVFGSSELVRRRLGVPHDPKHGPDSADWLGVTMRRDDSVCGAIVVQSYDRPDCYGTEEQALLVFVAQHILTALDRHQAREELERRVEERTKALQLSNRDLHSEILERQRAERLQRALYRIAELSITAETLEIFYAQVHAVVNELLDARNFYIALLSEDGTRLEFPYSIDEHDAHRASRLLDSGMTEHVLETGRALLTDPHRMAGFRGHGTVAHCWLGVPLYRDNTVVGVIAVQSYSPEVTFTTRDQDLLNFVANHISIGLTRKQEQERLVLAHAELEQRIHSRTRELAMANAELLEQIGERMRAEQQLTHQARHDELTGLPNRSQLLDHLAVAVTKAHASARHRPALEDPCGFAVLFLDLDRFKLINDSVGHSAGDDLLVEAGRRIVSAVRDHDLVARLGGDEFAVLVNDIEGVHVAKSLAQRILHLLGQAYWIAGREVFPSASVGIVMWQPRYLSGTDLLRDADAAMYRAKASGRDRWAVFDEDMREEASRILDLEADLRRAINGDNFIPYYQPIMSLDGLRIVGHEALLRWRHPTRGLLAPGEFIGLGEDNGLIEEVDWLMYAQVITRLSRGVEGYVSVNVSPRHFRSADFAERLMRLIHNAGANPNQLRIEITEVALFDDIGRTLSTLHTLRSHGVLAQLDDFGTGYSALSCLHRFPIECLKIDRSFVAGLTGEKQAESIAVVRAIQALAGTLGIHTIGEGIETEAQRDILFELGCERGQGYLLGRPAPQMRLAAIADPA